MKPATPLPWRLEETTRFDDSGGNLYIDGVTGNLDCDEQDAAYIVHACNNYPRLVEAVRNLTGPVLQIKFDEARALLSECEQEESR